MTLSLKRKLIILTITPLVLLASMGAFLVFQNWQNLGRLSAAENRLTLIASLSKVVNAAQKERGTSSLFLSGATEESRLPPLRVGSDVAWKDVLPLIRASDLPTWLLDDMTAAYDKLVLLRVAVDARSVLERSSFGSYTEFIATMLDAMKYATQIDVPGVSSYFTTILLFEDTKEYAGRTRAMASSVFALDLPLLDEYATELITMNSAISVNLDSRVYLASPEIEMAIAELRSSQPWSDMQSAITRLMGRYQTGSYGRDGKEFFDTATKVVDSIQAIIDRSNLEAEAFVSGRKSAWGSRTNWATWPATSTRLPASSAASSTASRRSRGSWKKA